MKPSPSELGASDAYNKQNARFTGHWHSSKRLEYIKSFKISGGDLSSADYGFHVMVVAKRIGLRLTKCIFRNTTVHTLQSESRIKRPKVEVTP